MAQREHLEPPPSQQSTRESWGFDDEGSIYKRPADPAPSPPAWKVRAVEAQAQKTLAKVQPALAKAETLQPQLRRLRHAGHTFRKAQAMHERGHGHGQRRPLTVARPRARGAGRPAARRTASRSRAGPGGSEPHSDEPGPSSGLAGPSPRFSRPWRPKTERRFAERYERAAGSES